MDRSHVQPVVGLYEGVAGLRPLLRRDVGKTHRARRVGRKIAQALSDRGDLEPAGTLESRRGACREAYAGLLRVDGRRVRVGTRVERRAGQVVGANRTHAHLDWLLLTKRPHLVPRLAPWSTRWPAHVWVGTTVENQRFAVKRIPYLLDIPCRVRFLSCEPLLGPVDLAQWIDELHWVIAGGESGGGARPTHPGWVRGLREQCVAGRVAFHFKQWGSWWPKEGTGEGPTVSFVRMTKKRAGRTLDGRCWNELPDVCESDRRV